MLFRISSNLFLSISLIWEVCYVHWKCFLNYFPSVENCLISNSGLVIFHLITYFSYFPLWDQYYGNKKWVIILGIFKQNIKPKCQIKWEEQYGGNIDWTQIWTKLKKIKVTNKVKEFQWKCLHNINYTEYRLKKNNLSNGKKIVWSPIRDWLYFTLLRIFHTSHFEINIMVIKNESKSPPHIVLT
jgi:hypothetical protein